MERVVLSRIPPDEKKLVGVRARHGKAAQQFTQAFLKSSIPRMSSDAIEDILLHRAVVLRYTRVKKTRGKKTKAKGLNAKERRELKVFQLKPEHQNNPQMIQQKLLKADFHGAVLTVVRSKCPSYVGTTGILVQELKHVFKIITKEDRLKTIPKRNSVFSVEMGDFITHIYGSRFELRSSERSAKKFKVKGNIDL
ncbi:ribonuclease P protein subunit p29 isoform X2 [Pygocentrus nattereri]|uniref:ribonuclease P protein subunit p29 isoform X2 n=1 Tax=Pygocentrus nattereri TaxID=42514 RepID=UPI00189114A2|nr:ribonuclease P protein subunit p29 isoform X2 [Pygocentrus nattereri]